MIVTIVPEDRVVLVDREARTVDLAGIDPDIHAVQWDGVKGEIEYKRGTKRGPEKIDTIAAFQVFINRWTAAAPPPPPPPLPKSAADVSVAELITQLIKDGTLTQAKIDAIKAARR